MLTTSAHEMGTCLQLADDYLQDKRFVLILDSMEIESLCDGLPIDHEEVSAMLVYADGGDIMEVWTTGYSRPYLLTAIYQREY